MRQSKNEFGFYNYELYIDTFNGLFKNQINFSRENNYGLWVVIRANSFSCKYYYNNLKRTGQDYSEGIFNRAIRTFEQKVNYKKFYGVGTHQCFSLYNIITGQLIYCMGNFKRDDFYNKIYNDNATMFKIPKVCNPDEINGPILSVLNKKAGGEAEFNYVYFNFTPSDDLDIVDKDGSIYFSPLCQLHRHLYRRYTDKNQIFNYSYDATFKKKKVESTYMYFWNLLELYHYYFQNELSNDDISTIQNKMQKIIEGDSNFNKLYPEYMYKHAFKNTDMYDKTSNLLSAKFIKKLFMDTKVIISKLCNQVLTKLNTNKTRYISPVDKIQISRQTNTNEKIISLVGYRSYSFVNTRASLNSIITLTVPPRTLDKKYKESIKKFLERKIVKKLYDIKNSNKNAVKKEIAKRIASSIQKINRKYYYIFYTDNYLISSQSQFNELYNTSSSSNAEINMSVITPEMKEKIMGKGDGKSFGYLNSILFGEALTIWGQNETMNNTILDIDNELELYLTLCKKSIENDGLLLDENLNSNWLIPAQYLHNELNEKNRKTFIIGKNLYYYTLTDYYNLMMENKTLDWFGYNIGQNVDKLDLDKILQENRKKVIY